jgi:hypothetical protein
MRALPFIGLLAASGSVFASPFEFAGLSRATTLQHVARRYPNSTVSGSYVHVSSKDTHDHIFGIELFGRTSVTDFASTLRVLIENTRLANSLRARFYPGTALRRRSGSSMRRRLIIGIWFGSWNSKPFNCSALGSTEMLSTLPRR